MFAIILYYQLDEYLKQQRELANQKANIMVLQMRPHFIYNTMTSIYYLCEQDAKKAQQVILDFTNYLRKNFTAIASDHTIAFKDELEHTKAYLAVEQAQFEDNLFVSYNIDHTDFSLPPLTLQPLVENAVKHGMDLDRGPLRITVSTVRTPSGSEILVEDNGQGFSDTAADTPHVALENIRSRLELMCGGTLSIAAEKDGGTIVKVFIPDQKK